MQVYRPALIPVSLALQAPLPPAIIFKSQAQLPLVLISVFFRVPASTAVHDQIYFACEGLCEQIHP